MIIEKRAIRLPESTIFSGLTTNLELNGQLRERTTEGETTIYTKQTYLDTEVNKNITGTYRTLLVDRLISELTRIHIPRSELHPQVAMFGKFVLALFQLTSIL